MRALHSAARAGHEFVVTVLLDRGADVNAAYDYVRWPTRALRASAQAAVPTLDVALSADGLAAGNAAGNARGSCLRRHRWCADAPAPFLGRPARGACWRTQTGDTALHYAAFNGRASVARLLLDRGADVSAILQVRGPKRVPAHACCIRSRLHCWGELRRPAALRMGCGVYAQTGETPLHHAALAALVTPVAALLLDRGAAIHAKDVVCGAIATHLHAPCCAHAFVPSRPPARCSVVGRRGPWRRGCRGDQGGKGQGGSHAA
jgi:hypothetical protein